MAATCAQAMSSAVLRIEAVTVFKELK